MLLSKVPSAKVERLPEAMVTAPEDIVPVTASREVVPTETTHETVLTVFYP
jgi:hypothetical protein